MLKVILVGHGKLGIEMKNSAEMIYGNLCNFSAVEFSDTDGTESLTKKIDKELEDTTSAIILTDLFGGTPYNMSCSMALLKKEKTLEIISGMSLPIVLEIASSLDNGMKLEAICQRVNEVSHEVVKIFSEQFVEEEEEI